MRIEQEGDPSDAGSNLLKHLEPFADQREIDEAKPGKIAAGPR